MKTRTVLAAPDTQQLQSVGLTKVYALTRASTDPDHKADQLVEYWHKGAAGWRATFSVDCLFASPEQAHNVIQELPPGGDPKFDYEVIPIRLSPVLEDTHFKA